MKKKIITLLSTLQGKVIISLEDNVKVKTLVRISSDKNLMRKLLSVKKKGRTFYERFICSLPL